MALVVRYFSTAGAGAEDGTTWANRAPLVVSAAWNSIITGFDFSGADGLECLVATGDYATISSTLNAAAFANPPTAANPLYVHGCDSSGARLAVPDPKWVSAQPGFATATLPVITLGTTHFINQGHWRLVRLVSTRTNGAVIQAGVWDWVSVENSASGSGAACVNGGVLTNCALKMTGTEYSYVGSGSAILWRNVRLEGNASATSGNRRGASTTSFELWCDCTIVNNPGVGLLVGASTNRTSQLRRCTIVNNGGDGVEVSTSSGTKVLYITDSLVTGNGGYGIEAGSGAVLYLAGCRLRSNTSGNVTGGGNTDTSSAWGNDTSTGTDAAEYVDAANGDYRIKYGSSLWGTGIGAGDEPPPTPAAIAEAVWTYADRALT